MRLAASDLAYWLVTRHDKSRQKILEARAELRDKWEISVNQLNESCVSSASTH
jgi:hypothetical protein